MAQNLQLDPTKKDYVVVAGSPVPTNRVFEATYFAVMIPQGKWLYGVPGQGSDVNTLQGIKRAGGIEQLFAAYSRDAVQRQVVNNGLAQSVGIRNLSTSRTGSSNQIEVIPSAVPVATQFNFTPVT
jgi:hypothetical protein